MILSFDKNLVILKLKPFGRFERFFGTMLCVINGTIVLKMASVSKQQTSSGRLLTSRDEDVLDKKRSKTVGSLSNTLHKVKILLRNII